MRKISIIVIAALMSIIPSGAFASWLQEFNVNDAGTFDQLGIWWISGDTFVSPAFGNFSVAGWASYDPSNINAYAYGSATADLDFDIAFADPKSTGTDFLLMAALNGEVKAANRFRIAYDDSKWSYTESIPIKDWYELGGGDPIDPATIPEPATMLLFGIGALGMGIIRKKK